MAAISEVRIPATIVVPLRAELEPGNSETAHVFLVADFDAVRIEVGVPAAAPEPVTYETFEYIPRHGGETPDD